VHLANTHKGHVPEKRRWISNEQYDYAEGVYQSGWYGPKSNVMGSHHRQTLFIKGSQPNQTGYWVIIDSVEAADEAQHQYKALFHSRRNEAVIDPETKSFKGHDISAWFEILPASPDEIAVKNIRAQTSPYIQGWHVVGRDKAPMNTAEFIWDAKGASTQAWVLTAGLTGEDSRIKDLTLKRLGQGEFLLSIDHKDGGRDLIYRRPNGPDLQPFQIGSQEINGDIGVISTDAKGKPMASLDLLPE